MKKRRFISSLLLSLLAITPFLLSSCSQAPTYKTLAEVNGNPVACPDASPSFQQYLSNAVPDSKIVFYKTFSDCIYSVEHGLTAGFVCDDPTYRYIRYNEHNRVKRLDEPVSHSDYGFLFRKDTSSDQLRNAINTYLVTNKTRLVDLANKWFPNDYDQTKNARVEPIVTYSESEANGSFTAFVIDINAPFGFVNNDGAQGYDADILVDFAKTCKYNINLVSYSSSSILAALDTGKCDVVVGGYNITSERKEKYNFSVPYYTGDIDFVVFDPNAPVTTNPVITGFYKTFIEDNRWQIFLNGTIMTLIITVVAAVAGTFIGYGLYLLGLNNKVCQKIINALTIFFSRTPMAVILMIFYYIIFGGIGMGAGLASIITFTIAFSLTMNGVIYNGVNAIDRNQFDSMYALGYSRTKGFNKVILPQAIRNFASNYTDEIVSLIKATSIVGFISVVDLTKATDLIRAASFQTFFPLITSAVIYFLLATLLIFIVRQIDKAINPYHKATKKEKKTKEEK